MASSGDRLGAGTWALLALRFAVELVLVAAVSIGFALTGLGPLALALLAAEAIGVGGLWLLGLPPGTDVGAGQR